MLDNEVHEILIKWVSTVTGLKVIKAYSSGERPPLPYVMVHMADVADLAGLSPHIDYTDTGTVEATPALPMEWRFQIHAYGGDPFGILRPIKSAAYLTQMTEVLRPLSIFDFGRIQSIPEKVLNGWEPRAVMSLNLRGNSTDSFMVDVIDQSTPHLISIEASNGVSEQ